MSTAIRRRRNKADIENFELSFTNAWSDLFNVPATICKNEVVVSNAEYTKVENSIPETHLIECAAARDASEKCASLRAACGDGS